MPVNSDYSPDAAHAADKISLTFTMDEREGKWWLASTLQHEKPFWHTLGHQLTQVLSRIRTCKDEIGLFEGQMRDLRVEDRPLPPVKELFDWVESDG